MRSKSALKIMSSINNDRSLTQNLKQANSTKQWDGLLSDLDAIGKRVRQLSDQEYIKNQKQSSRQRKCCANRFVHKDKKMNKNNNQKLRINTTYDCSRSMSRKKSNRNVTRSKLKHNTSQKVININRESTCASSYRKGYLCEECGHNGNNQCKNVMQLHHQLKCQEVIIENRKLKQANQDLLSKNLQLEQKLKHQARNQLVSTLSSKQKVQRHKGNEIILKIIKHNQKDSSNNSIQDFFAQSNQICIELRPSRYFNTKQEQQQICIQPPKKLNKPEPRRKFYDLSKGWRAQKQNTIIEPPIVTENKHEKNPSELKNLEEEFDRLMQISHLQRNKTKKRAIWSEMKNVASQLKMMRYFTQL